MKIEDFLTVGKKVYVDSENSVSVYPKGHLNEFSHKVEIITRDFVLLVNLENELMKMKLFSFDIVIDGQKKWGFRKVNDEKKDVKNIVPDYYNKGGIDVNEFAERKFPVDQLRGFYRINIIKYVTRYEDKNGVEDLIKAKTYLGKLIELEKKNK